MKLLVLFFLSLVLSACQHASNKKAFVKKETHLDSFYAKRDSVRIVKDKEHQADSVKQEAALVKILEYARKHLASAYENKELQISADSAMNAYLSFGNIFSKDKKHLIIQNRVNYYEFNENVYLVKGSEFVNILKETISDLTFVVDSVGDVNGDHYKDFLLNWYPESGCCARSVFNVYLYLPESGLLSKKYEFINPTFYPAEKIIRGVSYGHPGEVPLYKYKWNGGKIDTVEYIYPADTLKQKFYRVRNYKELENPQKRKTLTKVPAEYRHIDGYDWFMNY